MTSTSTDHDTTQTPGIGVILCNLGTPSAPEPAAVKRYLAEFLGDPRVVEIPALIWKPILHGLILPRRPKESAQKYQQVWLEDGGSPLLYHTEQQALLLRGWLGEAGIRNVQVAAGMRYGEPGLKSLLERWYQSGLRRILIVPLYPQYSATTTASVYDVAYAWAASKRDIPDLRIVNQYAEFDGYIAALEETVRKHWSSHGRPEQLVMSYHGIPARNVQLGDPYQSQCLATSKRLAERLGLNESQYRVTFQSRFGKARWLEPYTQPTLEQLAQSGTKVVDVICPGFPADCLETLEEINMEVREAFLHHGGQEFRYIPCLNEQPRWISALRDLVQQNLRAWER
ncbi:ferrochelatase [Lampropedia aestuarii]|uniref:ferrochelatase n=1 Tax=Lampropedia aestuarii TaxID=2562762 RepID=UPI002468EB43|nr:ferrochelatase [Lampropedia aestuarii]MDH5856904.1 ferrochelatase [Lampropedia aestuarii]